MALVAYVRLVQRGRSHLAYAGPLAHYAVLPVRAGRRVGSRLNSHDVLAPYCQRKQGIVVQRLDRDDRQEGRWQELVVEDRRTSPAEVAAVRIDFRSWLASLPRRNRRIAELLATGEATGRVARNAVQECGADSAARLGWSKTSSRCFTCGVNPSAGEPGGSKWLGGRDGTRIVGSLWTS